MSNIIALNRIQNITNEINEINLNIEKLNFNIENLKAQAILLKEKENKEIKKILLNIFKERFELMMKEKYLKEGEYSFGESLLLEQYRFYKNAGSLCNHLHLFTLIIITDILFSFLNEKLLKKGNFNFN